jgi:serine/threonine protein phosphatase 1
MWNARTLFREPNRGLSKNIILYAIGDVHGSRDLLSAMLTKIDAKARAEHPEIRAKIILLGDYVDKGVDSKGVIDLLLQARDNPMFDWIFLKGNHEDAMLTFLERPNFGPQWLSYGAAHTLSSYGVPIPNNRDDDIAWEETASKLLAMMPYEHLQFLTGLPIFVHVESYFFVHAGIRPGRALRNQEDGDMLWIRRSFLDSKGKLPAIVVHGHSPDMEPYADHRRIGVDTGAYATGRLTAVQLRGHDVEWLHVTRAEMVAGTT